MTVLAKNPRAAYEYELIERIEAGIQLTGSEVKSAKSGRISLKGAYVAIRGGEAYLVGATIARYPPAGPQPGYDPGRTRRLLLHQSELKRLIGRVQTGGLTLIPVSLYTKAGLVKLGIALARGKKKYEKREAIRKREAEREIRAKMKR